MIITNREKKKKLYFKGEYYKQCYVKYSLANLLLFLVIFIFFGI